MKPTLRWVPILAAAAIGNAHAEDLSRLSLEDLLNVDVEGASRYTQPIAEAPATATVIDAEDIRRYGYSQFSDALRMARGVYTSYDRTYTYLGVRGFNRPGDYNSRILMLVDGVRSNDTVYDQAMMGNEAPISLDWIKRIEFVPGPASALYGGNALFGVANAVLWSGADLNGTRISAEAGSAGTAGVNVLSGRQLENGADWIVGVSSWNRHGENLRYDEFASRGNGVARGLDGQHYFKAFTKLSSQGWRFLATYSNRYKDVPTAYFGTDFNAAGTNDRDEHLHLDLTHSTSLSKDWSQFAHVQLGAYKYTANYVYYGTLGTLNRDYTLNTWWDGEYQLTYTGFDGHRVLFGGEVRHSPHQDQYNWDVGTTNPSLNAQYHSTAYGLYMQDEWRLSSHWLANLGGRIDHVTNAGTIGSPRLALIYRPQTETTAKLIYGRAFRAANAYERFYTIGNFQGNPDLKPERIETRELSVDHALTAATRVGVSHYRYTIHNLIDQVLDGNGNGQYVNQPDMDAHGWEVEAESLVGLGWRIRGSVAWQRVDQSSGEPINSPHRLGKLFIDGPVFDGWTGAFELQAMSRRKARTDSVGGNAVARLVLRQSRQGPYGQWSLIINNLANRNYADPASQDFVQNVLPQDTRQWLLRWEYGL